MTMLLEATLVSFFHSDYSSLDPKLPFEEYIMDKSSFYSNMLYKLHTYVRYVHICILIWDN